MQETEYINVYGARVHNLKDIDAEIPRNVSLIHIFMAQNQRRFVDIGDHIGNGKCFSRSCLLYTSRCV